MDIGLEYAIVFWLRMMLCSSMQGDLYIKENGYSYSHFAGASIDQGIAYLLMIVALVLTYLIHPMDASPFNLF